MYPINLFEEWMHFNSFLQSLGHNTTQPLTGTLRHELNNGAKKEEMIREAKKSKI